ncbi:MAG: hypothetical protein P4L42_07510 [Desulfocapsaceae bacterium]|nr:hypothetical protein [Desulfocapsaceae bacterium]
MKKAVLAVALAAALGLTGMQHATAGVSDGKTPAQSQQIQKFDDATKEKIAKFKSDTKDIRRQMAMKGAEEAALIRSESPDVEAVKKAAGELFDLRASLFDKAREAGLFALSKRGGEEGKPTDRQAKIEKFMTDTKDIRKQLFVKRAEEQALLHGRTPNAATVAQVAGELFDLRSSLQEKAQAVGMGRPFGKMGEKGQRTGFHHRDFGMMDHGMQQDRDFTAAEGLAVDTDAAE